MGYAHSTPLKGVVQPAKKPTLLVLPCEGRYNNCKILQKIQVSAINEAACDLAREVADEGDCLVAGGVSQTPTYLSGKGKEACQVEFKKQLAAFMKKDVDFLIAEVCIIPYCALPTVSASCSTMYYYELREWKGLINNRLVLACMALESTSQYVTINVPKTSVSQWIVGV